MNGKREMSRWISSSLAFTRGKQGRGEKEIKGAKAKSGKEERRAAGSEHRRQKERERRGLPYQHSLILQWMKLPFSVSLCLRSLLSAQAWGFAVVINLCMDMSACVRVCVYVIGTRESRFVRAQVGVCV